MYSVHSFGYTILPVTLKSKHTSVLVLAMVVRTAASVSLPLSPTLFATASFNRSTITLASSTERSRVKLSRSRARRGKVGSAFWDCISGSSDLWGEENPV